MYGKKTASNVWLNTWQVTSQGEFIIPMPAPLCKPTAVWTGYTVKKTFFSCSFSLLHTHTVKSALSLSLSICWYKSSLWWPAPRVLSLTLHIDFVPSQEMISSPTGITLFMHIHAPMHTVCCKNRLSLSLALSHTDLRIHHTTWQCMAVSQYLQLKINK